MRFSPHKKIPKTNKYICKCTAERYLVGSEDVWVVVEVAQRAQSVLVLLELDEAVAQRLSHHLVLHRLPVVHHPALGGHVEVGLKKKNNKKKRWDNGTP